MRGVEVVRREGEVVFLLAEVVGLRAVAQPGQLEPEGTAPVAEKDDLVAPVGGVLLAHGLETEGLVVEPQAAFEIEDVEVEVVEGEHERASFVWIDSIITAKGERGQARTKHPACIPAPEGL